MKRSLFFLFVLAMVLFFGYGSTVLYASDYMAGELDPESEEGEGSFLIGLREIEYSLQLLAYNSRLDSAESTLNPGKSFLHLETDVASFEIRPDLTWKKLDFPVDFSVKPRLRLDYVRAWDDGPRENDDRFADDFFINEWLVRLALSPELFLSYGRENVQWGPSLLFSPSNPFFKDNGRSNPKLELPGMDFARLVYIPSMVWTISLIANTGAGRQDFSIGSFCQTYALKVDYFGLKNYGGLIFSFQDDGDESRSKVGFWGGETVGDALLFYGEGAASLGSDALYPQDDPLIATGGSLTFSKKDDSAMSWQVLLGTAYTFLNGATVNFEYIYNGLGYDNEEADLFFEIRQQSAAIFSNPTDSLDAALAGSNLAGAFEPGLRFLRRNYLMAQYRQNDIKDVFDLLLRCTSNMDDNSWQFLVNSSYYLGEHAEFFLVGSLYTGHSDSEYGSFLDSQLMIGIQYSF